MSEGPTQPEDEFYCDENVSRLFRNTVDLVAKSRNNLLIENHNIQDAWYLVKTILLEAAHRRDPVTILSGNLNLEFYNSLTEPLQQVLKNDCPVRVYLSESPFPDGEEENHFAGLIEMKRSSTKDPSKYEIKCAHLDKPANHLIYAGSKGEMYRMETDTKNHTAFGSFGAKGSGEEVVRAAEKSIQRIKARALAEAASGKQPTQ